MSPVKPRTASHVDTDITTPRTLAERAYLSLRSDVICGKLAPGEKLRVEHLKDQYQVGASTLREALSLLVSDALVSAEGQRGFRVAPISLTDLEDVTNTRVMLETEALRQSIRRGDDDWELALTASYERLTSTENTGPGAVPLEWELRNKKFHEALISAYDSPWTKYLLAILYRHGERYRNINWRLTVAHVTDRNVHEEHEEIYLAAVNRQEARAALALEAHVRITHDIVKRQAQKM